MKRILVIALVCLSGVASAQPVTIGWRPPYPCSVDQVIKWTGSVWACGTDSSVSDGDKGDVTVGTGGTVWTVNSGAVAYSELSGAFTTVNVIPVGTGTGLAVTPLTYDGTWLDFNGKWGIEAATGYSYLDGFLGIDGDLQATNITAASDGYFCSTGTGACSLSVGNGLGIYSHAATGVTDPGGIVQALTAGESSTVDTTANSIHAAGLTGWSTATKSAGSNTLYSVGVIGHGSGGDTNLSFWGQAGTLQQDGAATIGTTLDVAGLATLTGGFALGADSSAASHKITNLTNGSSAQDAAAFGQIATAISTAINGTSGRSARLNSTSTVATGAFVDDGTNVTLAGTSTLTGLVTATAGVTTPANLTTTASGDLVSADDLTVADDATITDMLAVTGVSNLTGLVTATAGGTTGNNWTTTGTGDLVSADDLTVADDATITDVLSAGSDGFEVASGRSYFGDTSATSIGNNVDVITIGNTGTGQTASTDLIDGSNSATVDTTGGAVTIAGTRQVITAAHSAGGTAALTSIGGYYESTGNADDSYGIYAKAKTPGAAVCSQCESTGINHSYAVYGENTGGGGLNWSGYFTGGVFHVDGTGADFASGISAQAGVTVTGSALDVQTSISNSTGTVALSDDLALGLDASSTLSFSNSAQGSFLNYDGRYGEVKEEYLWGGGIANASSAAWMSCTSSGTGAACGINGQTSAAGRVGVQRMFTGTTSTGRAGLRTNTIAIDPNDGVFSTRNVWRAATLSSGTEGYAVQAGFASSQTAVAQTDGCFATYDERNVLGANGSNTHSLVFTCCKASACLSYLVDGATTCDGSFTSVATTIAANTWLETDVRLDSDGGNASLWADTGSGLTKRCQITNAANLPVATVGFSLNIIKSVGTNDRNFDVDYSDFRWLLDSAR